MLSTVYPKRFWQDSSLSDKRGAVNDTGLVQKVAIPFEEPSVAVIKLPKIELGRPEHGAIAINGSAITAGYKQPFVWPVGLNRFT